MGVKFVVDQPLALRAVRFYKDAAETGPHTVSSVDCHRSSSRDGPRALGERFGLAGAGACDSARVRLGEHTVRRVDESENAFFVATTSGLATQVVSGPLRSVADGLNGVFGFVAGTFPTRAE